MIIFDLGGVILKEAETNLSSAIASEGQIDKTQPIPRIFNRMFEFINVLYKRDCKKDWIIGTLTAEEIIKEIKDNIDKPEFSSFFKSQQEQKLIKFGSEIILLPAKLTEFTEVYEEGYQFIERCKAKNIRVCILSNWDPFSFNLIKAKFHKLFNLFEATDLFLPANIGYVKPELEVYKFVLEHTSSEPQQTFFIDDNLLNVTEAKKLGIKSVLHQGNWSTTEHELKSQGLNL